ncbi:DUF2971 domain-containing protein [Rhizobium leguminosarum]|uniref:DUF2971 domain-containing protein n=1 Tax=Rhizobium leguminosarum TaxID=384 RepID=UPI001FDEB3BF|nr:DUF2971 domain-containing protein [Rhizobium leguminosarum]
MAVKKGKTSKLKVKAAYLPGFLSHYTTLEGLKGIIKSRALWASNASFLNDRAELIHALKASERAIKMLSSKKAYKSWESMLRSVYDELSEGLKADTYVACFCKDDDNLSQWRAYGGSVQGISVTFDRVALSKRLQQDNALLYKVTYAKFSTASKLHDALADELVAIAKLDEFSGQDDDAKYADLFRRFSSLLPKFKHLGFQDEREWRYVVQQPTQNKMVDFRISSNKIVPYIVIGESGELLPIEDVRIGPGPDPELTARSVQTFLKAMGYNIDVDISDVPFRP